MVKAFILAAGEGKRMRPLTEKRPKPMLHVAGKPLLQHTIEALASAGVEEAVILTGWKGEKIRKHFGRGGKYGIKIRYITQNMRNGTGGAVYLARKHMKEHFIALNGDVIVGMDTTKEMVKRAEKGNSTISAVKSGHPERYGVLKLKEKGKKDYLAGIIEKPENPPSDLINAGVYVFPPSVFDAISRTGLSERGEIEITDSIELLINGDGVKKEDFQVHEISDGWMDIGYPWDLLDANKMVVERLSAESGGEFWRNEGTIEENVHIKGRVKVGKGSVLKSGTYIEGNVVIGEDCQIGPNAYIRGTTSLGNGCKVGGAAEVKNSVIMDHSKIPHHNYVGDSIIGDGCNLGSGTKVANLRLDDSHISVTIEGERIDTGRRKLGVIMGDNVKTGVNSMIDVGTVIGSDCFIGPGAKVYGYISFGSKIM